MKPLFILELATISSSPLNVFTIGEEIGVALASLFVKDDGFNGGWNNVDTTSLEECITHGPWGGSLGKDWVYMPQGFIKTIRILYGKVIDGIIFQSDTHTSETQSSGFGGKSGCQHTTICIHYPNEYITSISGTTFYYGGSEVVMSLSLETNWRKYGPYGCNQGARFSYDGKGGVVVGFHGKAGKNLDAIGIYVMPKSLALNQNSTCKEHSRPEKCCRVSRMGIPKDAGPWGDSGGKTWDDGFFHNVKQIRVHVGDSKRVINVIQFEYVKRDCKSFLSPKHGGTDGDKLELIDLDGEKEYLTGISGFYGPVEGFNGLKGITCIAFHTSKKMYGPYGQESGGAGDVYFTSTYGGRVGGFHGRSCEFLTAIGVHMEYI